MGLIVTVGWVVVVLAAGAPLLRPRPRLVAPIVIEARRPRRRPRRLAPALIVGLAVAAWVTGTSLGVVALIGVALVLRGRRRLEARRAWARQVRVALPDAADLAAIAAEAGATPPAVVEALARWAPFPVAGAATRVQQRWGTGEPFAVALGAFVDELGPAAAPIVRVMVASHRDGAPLGPAMRAVADQLRADRRRAADARRLGVTLLFPLTLCVLPALALMVLAPVVVEIAHSLRL